jgi:hypothetical protein
MSADGRSEMANETSTTPQERENILGLSTSELAGLTVDELTDNKTAITMVMHYYKKLVDENSTLRNENNTLRTYVDGYERKKIYATVGATMLAISNVLIGFGVNLLTTSTTWPGIATIVPGVALIAVGLYFSYKDVG